LTAHSRSGSATGEAASYNRLALPIAAGILEPLGFTLSPQAGANSMPGSA